MLRINYYGCWLVAILISGLLVTKSVLAQTESGYAQTKYPIVLVHGFFGFDDVLGIDYFYHIPEQLNQNGGRVYVAAVSAANSSELRGEQLLKQVEYVLALTGASKVNLFGHSQGAQTSRYVASVKPEIVASVTSIGGVNWGSPVADLIQQRIDNEPKRQARAEKVANALATLVELFSGHKELPQDFLASLSVLTTAGTQAFNQKYQEGVPTKYCGEGEMLAANGVYYFSWSGAEPFTNIFDPFDGALLATSLAFDEPNDGLVSACSSHLGKVLKDNYQMNHLDQVNHSFGIHHFFETDPVAVYLQQANRLKNMGL